MRHNKRTKAIDEATDSSMLVVHMNIECTRCKRCVWYGGQRYGKKGATPCMAYEAI